MHGRRGWRTLALAVAFATVAAAALAQHRPVSALNWAFGGTVHTVARAGRVAFVGGRFNAVASRHNVTGGFAVASPATSQRALRAVRVHGNVNAIVDDGRWRLVRGRQLHLRRPGTPAADRTHPGRTDASTPRGRAG